MNTTLRNTMLAAGSALALTAVYAHFVEPRWLQCTRTSLHFPDLPEPLEGLTIALITDLHTRRSSPGRLLERVVRRTMREKPALIAITGDLAASEAMLERTLDALMQLNAPLGVYLVPGNHDYTDIGIERWHDAVSRRPGLIDLTNEADIIEVTTPGTDDTARLCVAGVDDLSHGRPELDALHDNAPRDFTILLAHNPDQAEQARRGIDRVDLVLSGHTHGGQIRLPVVGAIVNSARHDDLYEAGVRRRPWTQVYTSKGLGTVRLPLRFLTRPELAMLTLTRAPRPGWRQRTN